MGASCSAGASAAPPPAVVVKQAADEEAFAPAASSSPTRAHAKPLMSIGMGVALMVALTFGPMVLLFFLSKAAALGGSPPAPAPQLAVEALGGPAARPAGEKALSIAGLVGPAAARSEAGGVEKAAFAAERDAASARAASRAAHARLGGVAGALEMPPARTPSLAAQSGGRTSLGGAEAVERP